MKQKKVKKLVEKSKQIFIFFDNVIVHFLLNGKKVLQNYKINFKMKIINLERV